MQDQASPLIAIVGQTASGKSELAMKLAEFFNGEIICADSMTVYKGFNIGVSKPSQLERSKISHHLLDVADPVRGFNTKSFQTLANNAIKDIDKRNKLPILVGGSGLYVDSILFGYHFLSSPSLKLRNKLNQMTLAELLQEAANLKLNTDSIDKYNKRRVVRLIETNGVKPIRQSIRPNTLVIGLQLRQKKLTKSIERRVNSMISNKLEDEVRNLSEIYGWEVEQMKAVGYREWKNYFEGKSSHTELVHQIIHDTLALAKKQNTWFKRNKSIHWFYNRYKFEEIVELTTTVLNK